MITLLLIFTVIFIAAVVATIAEGDRVFCFFATLLLGGFLVMTINVAGSIIEGPIRTYDTKQDLAALADRSETSGQFFLGSGRISERPAYLYYQQNDDGSMEQKTTRAKGIKVFEDQESGAYAVEECREYGSKMFWNNSSTRCHVTEFHVPEGTVKQGFNLDLED